jgi:O-acetyl-ADP-ribose deacetylase (regulator of RNase III)
MKIIHQGKLNHVELTFAVGDLFDAQVDAIVSSEQTDFILSGNPKSISGQIWQRFGAAVQQELDELTDGQVLRAGTVLETSGGSDFVRIFHAGFHEPDDWPGVPGGSEGADYFEAIGSCVRQILETARAQKLSSVAFPLIGCGLFGLDEKMLVLQFLDAIETLDERLTDDEHLNAWLVIRDRDQFDSIVDVLFALLLRHRSETIAVQLEPSGIPVLDRFAARLGHRSNEDWAKWQLCRFAEIALEVMCYGLCRATIPSPSPESMFDEGIVATFGVIREHALKLAASPTIDAGSWGARFFTSVLKNDASVRALEIVNTQRNNLAHGRKSLPLGEIRGLTIQGLQLGAWGKIAQVDGKFWLADWIPWVVVSSSSNGQAGLFERWQKNAIRYLVPETGEVFKVPRTTSASSLLSG